jgi:hypothetical protein
MSEYVIINKSNIEQLILDLKKELGVSESQGDKIRASIEHFEIEAYKNVLSQSLPLIPEIEKAYHAGTQHNQLSLMFDNPLGRYVSNLKHSLNQTNHKNVLDSHGLYERSHSGYESVVVQKNTEYTILLKENGLWYFNDINLGEISEETQEVLCDLYKINLIGENDK